MRFSKRSFDSEGILIDSREFTRALVNGDDDAWRKFYCLYSPRLRGYLSTCWYGEPDAIDDLLQNTMLRAVKYIRVFNDHEILWSWLTVLARSSATDHGRKRQRFHAFLDRFRKEVPAVDSCNLDERLTLALANLGSGDRSLVQMKYEDGRTVREIAAALNITEKTVESRLTRCRKRLRKHLARLEP